MADKEPKDRSDEMEHDLHRLEEHIGDAEKRLEARRKDADPDAVTAGEVQPDGGSAEAVATEVAAEQAPEAS